MIETQFNRTVKVFRSDNVQEYNDKSFLSFLDSYGTLPQRSCPYTSQQNGRAGQKHCHILDVVRTLLISASLPKRFWSEAALTAVYTINRIPSPTTHNKSPFELLYDQTPDYSSLRVFGCACFISLSPHERTKLQPRTRLCCFLGYGVSQKGFRCYDPFLIAFVSPVMLSFWNIVLSRVFSNFLHPLPYSLPFLLIFSSLSILNLWRILQQDRKSTRLNSSHLRTSRMPSSA